MHSDLDRSPQVAEQLRSLAAQSVPPFGWEEFRRRAALRAAAPRSAWRLAAFAAALAVLVAGAAMWSRVSSLGHPVPVAVNRGQAERPLPAMPDPLVIKQARASEQWLARLPREPAVARVGTRAAVAALEDRIALVDDTLSDARLDAVDPAHVFVLQRERARLVNSLAQVRYAETLAPVAP